MGVKLTVNGTLLGCEHRSSDDSDGPGFMSFTVLPDTSREVLDLWAFGDSAAGHYLLEAFRSDGPQPVCVGVELRAKLNKAGNGANLSTGLQWVIDLDGERRDGKITPAGISAA